MCDSGHSGGRPHNPRNTKFQSAAHNRREYEENNQAHVGARVKKEMENEG